MTPDALIEALSSIVETTKLGAVIYRNAAGEYHRTAGPAIVYPDGNQRWCRNGVYHRTDGPAIVYPNGMRAWYLNGVAMVEDEHNRRIASGDYHDV